MNISRFMQRITFWKMDNMKELSARNCGKRFTQSVWQQELNSHPKSVRIGHTFDGDIKVSPLWKFNVYEQTRLDK